MPVQLIQNSYGKSSVRLTKVSREGQRHSLCEMSVDILLEGDFQTSYTAGDNALIVATDTMKNTVYALAREHPLTNIESFAISLARHFTLNNDHVETSTVSIRQSGWQRISVNGAPHDHSFQSTGAEKRTCRVQQSRQKTSVQAGIEDLVVLKTTDSAFSGFLRDRYTTLADTDERIMATSVKAEWIYKSGESDWNASHAAVRTALLEVFATHNSLAVQQTLYAMGERALADCPDVEEISLVLPNQHRLLVNLAPFGQTNANEIFVPTDEPFGLITGTLRRV